VSAGLAGIIFWLSVASCVVAQVAIIRATSRVSRLTAGDAGAALPHPRRWLEIVWVVLPAIALGVLLAVTWRTLDAPRTDAHVPPTARAPQQLP
jgi:heme/copper-type cytochrome/quinol oxidase subunit 2